MISFQNDILRKKMISFSLALWDLISIRWRSCWQRLTGLCPCEIFSRFIMEISQFQFTTPIRCSLLRP